MDFDIEIEYPMESLSIAKVFYEHGRLDRLLERLNDNTTISWDDLSYIEQISAVSVFEDTRCYWQEERYSQREDWRPERTVLVLRDPLLTRYDRLCREYEAQKGVEAFRSIRRAGYPAAGLELRRMKRQRRIR